MNQEASWRHRANRVINDAHANFSQPIDLNVLADVACLSKFHFARTFTRECMQSPLRYLWQLRLERAARKLVLEAGRPITDIAFACGFASPQAFAQTFKAGFGTSPQEFRKAGGISNYQSRKERVCTKPSLSSVTIEARPALQLAYIRHFGTGRSGSVQSTYNWLKAWAWRNNINPEISPLIGVCPDNPRFTSAPFSIYDAAIPVSQTVVEDEAVSIQKIPAGTYAVVRIEMPYWQHLAIWEWLVSEWLHDAGETYVQKWSYECFPPAPGRSHSEISPTELCLRLEDRGSSMYRMRRRWWMFRLFDLLARLIPFPGKKTGVLVIRMDGIGDMMLFRSALDQYAETFGVAKTDITVLGCDSWSTIKDIVFPDYRVVTLNEHRFAKNPLYRFQTALRVRALRARIVVNDAYFRRALMADSLVWLSGAETAISSLPYISERTKPEFTYYLSQVDQIVPTGDYPTHELVRHATFLSEFSGRKVAPTVAQIPTPSVDVPIPTDTPFAVLVPGSNEPGRRWPFSSYANLATRLIESGIRVVLAGRSAEVGAAQDRAELVQLGAIDLTDKTTLPQLIALMAKADLVVSNDTGPAHVAIGVGAPTVVVVGGGHFESFVPYPKAITPDHVRFVHYEMDCYHCFWRCHLRDDERQSFPCVASVEDAAVWSASQSVMATISNTKV